MVLAWNSKITGSYWSVTSIINDVHGVNFWRLHYQYDYQIRDLAVHFNVSCAAWVKLCNRFDFTQIFYGWQNYPWLTFCDHLHCFSNLFGPRPIIRKFSYRCSQFYRLQYRLTASLQYLRGLTFARISYHC